MNYRRLGNTGLRVSEIGLGSYRTYGQKIDLRGSIACVHKALEVGINFFDTADTYGQGEAERFLGKALHDVSRSHVVMATKCYFPMSNHPNDRGLSRKHLVESVERSLANLQWDHLDLLQCHRFDLETPLEETIRAISDLIRQGKVLYWGVSRWSAPQLEKAFGIADVLHVDSPVAHQVPYNLLYRHIEQEGVLESSRRFGLGLVTYYPLSQGVLTGKYTGGHVPSGSRACDPEDLKRMYDFRPEILVQVERLKSLALRLGLSLPELAIGWCLRESAVSCVLMGATNPSQIEENVKASGVRIPEEVLEEIRAILQPALGSVSCGST